MKVLVVVNPRAGRGRRGRSRDALTRALRSLSLDFDLVETERPGHAAGIVAACGPDHDGVLVVGGDGTLHEALQSLDLERLRLAVLPWGSGNDFAWLHGWSPDPASCAARIAANGERRIDLGSWESDLQQGPARSGRFHNSVGLGFEAVVNHESHRVTAVRGPLIYGVALARTLRRFRAYPVRMTWDSGALEGDVALVTVANGKRVGGAFLLAPDARTDDGRLDLVYAGRIGRLRMLSLLPRTLNGSHVRSRVVRTARTVTLHVAAPEGIPAYVDGEFLGMRLTSLALRVLPGALRSF